MGCFEKVFFVYADEAIAALAEGLPVTAVFNAAPEKGQGESARLGLIAQGSLEKKSSPRSNTSYLRYALHGEEMYYMFFPCDQPLLDQGTIRLLLDAARPGCIVEPACAGGNRSPSLFCGSFRDELLALKQGEHPRLLKERHKAALITVETPDPALLVDIDTPEDLQRAESREQRVERRGSRE
jgi:CTP:molybdopterin cytidylyltransferase MocA